MGVEINICNSNFDNGVEINQNIHTKGIDDVIINFNELEIKGKTKILQTLDIEKVLHELGKEMPLMNTDSQEYNEIQEILKVPNRDKGEIINRIIKHLGEFSQGVLASVVANLLMRV